MNLTSLSSTDFRKIAKLLERRQNLQTKVAEIEQALAAYEGGAAPAASAPAAKPKGLRRGKVKRGELKEAIIELVRGAGKAGISVKEVAAQLHVKTDNVRVWFFSTGKRVAEIKKVGRARYAWVG